MADFQLDIDIRKALQDLKSFRQEAVGTQGDLSAIEAANKAAFDRGSVLGYTDAINNLQKEWQELKTASSTLKSALKNATDPNAIKLYTDGIAKAEKGMAKLETAAKKAGIQLDKSNKSMSTGREVAENFFGSFAKASLITAAISIVVKFTKEAVLMASQIEKSRKQFEALTGDADKAFRIISDLQGFSDKNFLPVDKVNEAGKSLIAFGENADNIVPILDRIANISAATGKDLNELTTIYGKARAAGVLYAEDINQLVDAGIPIIQQFADQMGVSTDQIKKLASEGKIGFTELELAFAELTSNGQIYAGQLAAQADTLDGKWNKLLTNFNSSRTRPIGEFFNNLGKYILDAANYLFDLEDRFFRFLGLIKEEQQGPKTFEEAFGFPSKEEQEKGILFLTDEQKKLNELRQRSAKDRERLENEANKKRTAAAQKQAERARELERRLAEEAARIELEKQRLVLDVMEDGIEKDLALVNFRFDQQAKAFEKYGLDTADLEARRWEAIIEVTEKYQNEQAKIEEQAQAERIKGLKDEQQRIEAERDLRLAQIETASAQAQGYLLRLEANGAKEKEIALAKEEFDKQTQAARLRAELAFQEKLLSLADPFDAARIAQIKESIALLKQEIENVEFDAGGDQTGSFLDNIIKSLGISPEDIGPLKQAVGEIVGYINEITEARLREAEAAVRAADTRVQAAEQALDKELQLNEQGFNSNVDLRRKELADAEAARQQAIQDRQRAARTQLAVDAATQASGLVTSSVNVIKGYSEIPIVGLALGLAQVAALIAFVTSLRAKSKAISNQQFKHGGGGRVGSDGVIVGPSHDNGGVVVPEYEGGEFFTSDGNKFAVVNKRMTNKHFDLLQAINNDDRPGMARVLDSLTGGPRVNFSGISDRIDAPGPANININTPGEGFTAKEKKELFGLLKSWKESGGTTYTTEGKHTVIRTGNRTTRIKNG